MKQVLLKMMMAGGAFVPFRVANRNKVIILTYHRFGEDGIGMKTSANLFSAQLDYLCRHYNITSLTKIAKHFVEGVELPPYSLAITIDDGYADTYEIAFPILRRYGISATIFLVTDFIDRRCWIWTDKLRFLALHTKSRDAGLTAEGQRLSLYGNERSTRIVSANKINEALKQMPDAIKEKIIERFFSAFNMTVPASPPDEFGAISWKHAHEMMNNGIEIGSHTVTHPILTKVDDAHLFREMVESKLKLETILAKKVNLFCYPNGGFNARIISAAEQSGYLCAVTTQPGFNDSRCQPLAFRRIDAEYDLAHFVQSTSGFEQVKNRIRRINVNAVGMET